MSSSRIPFVDKSPRPTKGRVWILQSFLLVAVAVGFGLWIYVRAGAPTS